MLDKRLVHNECLRILESRIVKCQKIIEDIQESSRSESKSSAGDKFETSREMLKQESDKIESQLQNLTVQWNELKSIKAELQVTEASHGALVMTNHGLFYISTAIGKVNMASQNIFAISRKSPMAISLNGKKEREVVEVNGRQIVINKIL